jgi:hypothetical protein
MPSPATVEMSPVETDILRTTQLPVSAMKILPDESTANPDGLLSSADVAAPPSPVYPAVALPARVDSVPVEAVHFSTVLVCRYV